ncbi:threonylcarbamoyl-AMP synthase [Patescibacteria group bacterium]|nr:threonylcarbamoyl-AMP synthase [Patescibacteria group bacterium]
MKSLKAVIHTGGVAVIRTDTLYGIVCNAHNPHAVDRVYKIKKRNPLKASIVLVADYKQIASFGITITPEMKERLDHYWPGKVSIILPAHDISVNTHYIHKGTGGIAFRMPDDPELRMMLKDIGPLIAPSANPEGEPPATTIDMARDYFGDQVDYYMDGGEVTNTTPSTIIKFSPSSDVEVIRE